jgi:hypothetical protein
MWRPDIHKYNVFLMSKTDEHPKPHSNDHAGLTFPLPTLISNAFQVRPGLSSLCIAVLAAYSIIYNLVVN